MGLKIIKATKLNSNIPGTTSLVTAGPLECQGATPCEPVTGNDSMPSAEIDQEAQNACALSSYDLDADGQSDDDLPGLVLPADPGDGGDQEPVEANELTQ